ncbi:hypothetical protein CF327_g6760 [Tilletia walkeri]|uniref:Mitochondrial import receptor subunit TOM20 n=1 Tax=Tilletia walkeri TaxID=117179 RepID=A0A8X7T5F4_9BASI|nr:hypothetical protein CF327_g6760 [Tilletia walkeri]KAE8268768.1 hypothetical protein A4X09_0g3569 [Tilletia walkeri]
MKTSTVVTVSAATLVSAGVAYALYFDYRRRNDATFRKTLRKQSKKASKAAAGAKGGDSASGSAGSIPRTPAERAAAIDRAYAEIKRADKEDAPKDYASVRSYFDHQVGLGETLTAAGPEAHYDAAIAFVKALRVYIEPLELLEIYGKALNKDVYAIVMELIAKDMIENTAGGAASGSAAAASSKLGDIDGDESTTKSTSTPSPAPAATTSTSASAPTTDTPAASSLTEPASASADAPTQAPTESVLESDTAPTSSTQTATSSSDDMMGSTTGPASTTSSQEWDAISASSAIGHNSSQPAPTPSTSTPSDSTQTPAATEVPSAVEESIAPAPAPAQAQAPTPSASHTAEPVLSEVDVEAEQDQPQQDEEVPAPAPELEELEPDAIGEESVADPPEVAPPTPAAAPAPAPPANVFPASETAAPSFAEVAAHATEEEKEEESVPSTSESWASVQPPSSIPKSPSGGNRDAPRWS